jgi:hypothetical protein
LTFQRSQRLILSSSFTSNPCGLSLAAVSPFLFSHLLSSFFVIFLLESALLFLLFYPSLFLFAGRIFFSSSFSSGAGGSLVAAWLLLGKLGSIDPWLQLQ